MKKEKLLYLIRSAIRTFSSRKCPNCGCETTRRIDQKYIVTRLMRCENCKLQFRHPVDPANFNSVFYQEDYEQHDGLTTDLPSASELKTLIDTEFANSNKNVSPFVPIFHALKKDRSPSVVDYGSSWGYMSYQFKRLGFTTQSFEISRPRARFGNEKLHLDIKTEVDQLKPANDIFFSSHVIEHVPSVAEMVRIAAKLLNKDGFFVAECPNGSRAFRDKKPHAFSQIWGLVHPSYIDEAFAQWIFKGNPYLIISSPYDLSIVNEWDQKSQVVKDVSGDQLMIIARPNISIT